MITSAPCCAVSVPPIQTFFAMNAKCCLYSDRRGIEFLQNIPLTECSLSFCSPVRSFLVAVWQKIFWQATLSNCRAEQAGHTLCHAPAWPSGAVAWCWPPLAPDNSWDSWERLLSRSGQNNLALHPAPPCHSELKSGDTFGSKIIYLSQKIKFIEWNFPKQKKSF